jgi:hypothetical protein
MIQYAHSSASGPNAGMMPEFFGTEPESWYDA